MTERLEVRFWKREVEIKGRSIDLVDLARAIEGTRSGVTLMVVEAEDSDCEINSTIPLVVDETTGKVKIGPMGKALAIRGGANYRGMLANEIDRFARGQIPGGSRHMHIDTYPDHFFLDHDSVPLLIERAEE